MKKIICLIDTFKIGGGAQTQLAGLALMLKEKGYQVKALSYFENNPEKSLEPLLQRAGVEVCCISGAYSKWSKFLGVYKVIKSFQPDYVIAYIDGATSISCMVKILNNNFKLIVSERNVTQYLSINEKIKFLLYHKADAIISNAYTQELYIKKCFPRLFNKVFTISNFVDTETFYKREFVENKQKHLRVLVVARVAEQKNVLGFLDALALLRNKGVKVFVDWYGANPSDYYTLCITKISDLNLNEYIMFHNPVGDITSIYHKLEYDVFCLPSYFEGCPNTIGEAMSCGYPILCSDVCDNNRYVKFGENGYLFNPKDITDIVSKIYMFINTSFKERVRMSENSRIAAEKLLSKSQFINKYLNLLS